MAIEQTIHVAEFQAALNKPGARDVQLPPEWEGTNPAWLLDIPSDEAANVERVSLRAGPALLIEDFNDDGTAGRVAVLRSTSEGMYCVLGNSRQVALRGCRRAPVTCADALS